MKKTINLLAIFFVVLQFQSYSQTTSVIDYAYKQLDTNSCNVFANETLVDNFKHRTSVSRPKYNDNSIKLETKNYNSNNLRATIYSIEFNFKIGYTYKISIYYKGEKNSADGYYPNVGLKLSPNNGGIDSNTNCVDPSLYSLSNIASFAQGSSGISYAWANDLINVTISQSASYLLVGAFRYPGTSQTGFVWVRKIQIVEIPPSASFTLSPSNVPITCGSTTPQTFTISNDNNTPGVTNYNWNLGATPNGWQLPNGNAAPGTYSTGTANTLTLTPVCGATQKNVSVTVTANGNNYNTNTSSVSITQPSLTISGSTGFCSGTSVYSINGSVPCNATVSWSASPSGIISLLPSGSSVTATKIGNGLVTLTAAIGACNNLTVNLGISVGAPPPADGVYPFSGNGNYCVGGGPYGFEILGAYGDPLGYEWIDYGPAQTTHYYNQGDQIQLGFSESGTHTIAVIANNSCGGSSAVTATVEVSSSCGWGFMASPNPASNTVDVSLDKNSQTMEMKEVVITDRFGNTVKRIGNSANLKRISININDLKTDMYIIRVFNGKEWKGKSILKQ